MLGAESLHQLLQIGHFAPGHLAGGLAADHKTAI